MSDGAQERFDLVVIGGGTAGLVASRTAASFGASVALVERGRLGGDCLWTGCVPSKALLEAAADAGRAGRTADQAFADAFARAKDAMTDIAPVDSAEALERNGVRVLLGSARFTAPRDLAVGERRIRFGQAVIATGSRPTLPPVPGLAAVNPLTTETLWDLDERPDRLLVIGGGAVGCELSQGMAGLGVAVVLVEQGPRLLPGDVPDAGAVVLDALRADHVDVRLGTEVARIEAPDGSGGGVAVLTDGARMPFDRVVAAAARVPDTTALGLAAAHVEVGRRGHVRVQRSLRTTNPRIWAAGDVTPLPQYTHTAGMNGSIVASNAVLGLRRTIDTDANPHVTYTQPEVAAVGLQATDADPARHRVVRVPNAEIDRAIAARRPAGFTEIVVDQHGRVVGTTVVGPRAGETIGEATLAVRNRVTASSIATTTHPYPTWSDGFWNACIAAYRHDLGSGVSATAVRALAGLRRLALRG